jgi:nucleoside-diphosphate-sugar epimerase
MRATMADELLADHAAGRLHVTIGRASDHFGPGGIGSALGESVFTAVLAGKPVRWLGPLDIPHTMSYLPDVARGLAVLGESDTADGRACHLPAAEPLTARAFTDLLQDALGRPIKLTATGPVGFWIASRFVPVLRELKETRHQWQHPFISDATAFTTAFGPLPVTPHTEAMRATVAWWRARADAGFMPPSAPAAATT